MGACLVEPTPGFDASGSGTTASSTGATSAADTGSGSSADGSTDGTSTGGGPQPLPLPPRGYRARTCGFDFDHDGEVGEDGECNVCDGATADPDGDGYAQPIYYVDCQGGVDPADGTANACLDASTPCLTINRALDEIPSASGPYDEQGLVCFTGTCTEALTMKSGRPKIATRPKRGIEVRDFDYPAQPTMVVGWDKDGDHEFPPVDGDDLAVLQPPAGEPAIHFDWGVYNTPTHDLELAHFVVSVPVVPDAPAQASPLFTDALAVDAPHERILLHDLSTRSLRQGNALSDTAIVGIDLRGYGETEADVHSSQYIYFAVENVEFLDHGSALFLSHADMDFDISGPIRLANLTTRALGCDKSDCDDGATISIWRMGGWIEQIEILASVFDANSDAWYPYEGTDPVADAGPTAIVVGECSQDVAIVDNEFVGFATALRVEGNGATIVQKYEDNRPCNGRDVDAVRFEGNFVRDTSDRLAGTTVTVLVQTANPSSNIGDDRTIASVRVVNNAVVVDHGLLGCWWVQAWGAAAGPIELAHNTCIAAIETAVPYPAPALVRILSPRAGAMSPVADVVVQGNLLTGQAAGDVAVAAEYVPPGLVADFNVFASDAAFRWNGGAATDLAGWQAASAHDAGSAGCVPEFWAPGDFHLAATDTCAGDRAAPLSDIAYDIDGDPRPPGGPWDAGADERSP